MKVSFRNELLTRVRVKRGYWWRIVQLIQIADEGIKSG